MQAPLDRAHFSHMTGGDLPLQREILELFRGQVEGWIERLVPGEHWRDAAHTLKGSARGIGLTVLAEVCEAAEASDDELAAITRLRAALQDALVAVASYDDELAALTGTAAVR